MAIRLDLYVDIVGKRLVNRAGQAFSMPAQFQGDTVPMSVTLLAPDPTLFNTYTAQDISGASLKLAVSDTPTGTAGGPTPFVTQFTWTQDTVNNRFTATVAFNTAELTTWLGSAASKTGYLELEMTEGAGVTTIYQGGLTINAEVIETGTVTVAAGLTPLSREEALALFVKKIGDPGETATFTSPNGTYQRIIGVNDDQTPMDYII